MMTVAEVRDVVPEDMESIGRVFLACFNGPPWNDGWSVEGAYQRLTDLFAAKHFRGAVALLDSTVVGAILGQKERWVDAYHFNLVEMCVLPGLQRRGIGTGLMRHLLRGLAREQVTNLYLLTAVDGPAASFYSKMGFYLSRGRIIMARNVDASP